ncbi:MAG: DUF268 domain-containing protein [Betaproteobacteria bacterium]|nr:DUF268 domain-containing protein [Betaproteobacteria bacterium]
MPLSRNPLARLVLRWGGLALNVRGVLSLPRIPGYLVQWRRFAAGSAMAAPARDTYPCLADATSRTAFDPHYFHQAAWLARRLAAASPERHVDVGSDVGMIGVLSAFVPVEFVDIRPLAVELSGLDPRAGSLLAMDHPSRSVASLSCLHVIEHVGLARYGDPLDPAGHEKAAAELVRVLAPGGDLYLSTPVGRERVCFNAHRVFSHATIARLFGELELRSFSLVDDGGTFHVSASHRDADACDYGCGLFHFRRQPSAGTGRS